MWYLYSVVLSFFEGPFGHPVLKVVDCVSFVVLCLGEVVVVVSLVVVVDAFLC